MEFKKKYSLGVAYLYSDSDIPNSSIIYSCERNFLFKRVIYAFRDDGFVVSGDSRKGTSFFYTWDLFDSYSKNPNYFFTFVKLPLMKNYIGFRFNEIDVPMGLSYSNFTPGTLWILFNLGSVKNDILLNLVNSKLKNNTKLTNKSNFYFLFWIFILFISIFFLKGESGIILLLIPILLYVIFNYNKSYKII